MQIVLSAQLLICSWVLCYSLLSMRPALAAPTTTTTVSTSTATSSSTTPTSTSNGTQTTSNSPVSLDLSSKNASISGAVVGHPVTVNIGGTNTAVQSTSVLTPAEYLAALSVLNSGHQTLTVNSAGQATGGSFQLPASASLSSLIVPTGVTGVFDFGSKQNLNLTGNLINSGNFYLVSTNHAVTSGSLSALNIVNNPGALLSSVLPSGGLAGFSNLVSNLSFTLNAVQNISNYGTIASAGSLSMHAGNSIANSVLSNVTSAANISALTNISMYAPTIINQGQVSAALNSVNIHTANLVNSGLLESVRGNISISNLVQKTLDIDNFGGLIKAHGNLSIINNGGKGSSTFLDGGVLNANKISFTDRRGAVSVAVNDISKNVSFNSSAVNLSVSNGTNGLSLSGLNRASSVGLSFAGAGDVTSGGFNTLGKNVSIDTSGSIKITGNIVTSPSSSGNGGFVFLDAGKTLSVKNISTIGKANGNGGNVTLSSGLGLNSLAINASGGSNGNPGIINIKSGLSGSGNATVSSITDNGVNGGGQVTVSTPGAINVSGSISAVNGTVTLQSTSSNINKIDVGTNGHLNLDSTSKPGSPFVLDLGLLAQLGSGNVNIGGSEGISSNIILSGNCNQCLGNLTSVTLKTSGIFSASGTTLTLDPGQSFNVIAAKGINTGSVIGGSNVSFQTSGQLTVDGKISIPNGNLSLAGSGFTINSAVDVGSGTVTLIPTANTNLSGGQLSQISAATLNIGNGSGTAGLTLTGSTDLRNISNNVAVNLAGNFSSSGSAIQLGDNAIMTVLAHNVSTGKIDGGAGLSVNARGVLNVNGDINMPNAPIALSGDLSANGAVVSLLSGTSIIGSSISISSGLGSITSGSNLTALSGPLSISSGGALSIQDNSQLSSFSNLSLKSIGNLAIGSNSGSGVSISAGSMESFDPYSAKGAFDPSMITSNGSVLIDTFQGGAGTGNVQIGSNVHLLAVGDGKNSNGSLAVLSAGNIGVGSGSWLAAVGGNLWLSAGGNVNIDHADLASVASNNASAGSTYSGGQIGIMAGAPTTNMAQVLAQLSAARSGTESVHSDASLASNTITMSNGSLLSVVQPSSLQISLSNNSVNLNGGVLFIDPPPSNTVNITGSNINAVGPQIVAAPLVIGPGTGSGAGSGTGTGTGAGGGGAGLGGGTGSGGGVPVVPVAITGVPTTTVGGVSSVPLLGSGSSVGDNFGSSGIFGSQIPSGSVSSNDISSRTSSTQEQISLTINSGNSVVASDTLEEGAIKTNHVRPAIFCSRPQLLKANDASDDDSWIIASSSCQPFTFEEHDGSLIVGAGPAKFAPAADRTLLLREGKMLVITVEKIHVVRTPFCNITIPVNTAAIVEVNLSGMVRVANLAGGKASVTICRNDETLILSAAPGEQLVLAEAASTEEQFAEFGFPGVAHTKVAAWNLELSGLRGQKLRFDRTEMAQYEPLLHCSMGCVNQTQLRRIEQLMKSMTSEEAVLKSMAPAKGKQLIHGSLPPQLQSSELRPVSFEDGVRVEPLALKTLNAGSAVVKYIGHCKVALNGPGIIVIDEGEALVSASKRTLVKMGATMVELKPGTVAMLGQHNGLIKVRNVFESKRTAITTTVANKKKLGLQVGQELIVGPKGVSLVRALSSDPVGRRRLNSLELSSGHTCISSEISLSSLMQNSSILAQLVRSQSDSDRDIASKIMKMAVCLSVVTASHGNYSMMNP